MSSTRNEDRSFAHDLTTLSRPSTSATHSTTEEISRETRHQQNDQDQEPLNVALQEEVPPDGGYGWICTACVFLINAHTWGVNSAWGIFLAHYLSHEIFPGASQLEYALIGGLSISQALVISPLTSASIEHFGTRTTLLIGTVLVFVALFSVSFATQIWHLFLSQGVCFGWGMGFLYITASTILPQWFSTKRSLALGIASAGAGLGGLAFNLGAGAGVQTLGTSWTYRILAFCSLAVNLVCSILLKDRNKTVIPQHHAFEFREIARIEVILVILWGFLTELGYIVLLYSLPHFALSIGLTTHQGSIVGALLNLGLGIGRPIIGYYSDSFGRINIATLATLVCGLLCLTLWVPAHSYAVLCVFAILVGSVCGTFWSTVTPVVAEVVGLKRLPSAFGVVCIALVLPTTFAEPVALQIVAAAGYLSSQIFVGGMFIIAATSMWLLRTWKIAQIEKKDLIERQAAGVMSPTRRESIARHDFWLTPRRMFMTRRV